MLKVVFYIVITYNVIKIGGVHHGWIKKRKNLYY